jgi:polyferredoxin
MFIAIMGTIAAIALIAGKRAKCHTICRMAHFMIIGRKIRNTTNLQVLQLTPNSEKCVNCKTCNKECPMSLEINQMVQTGNMEKSEECILCGSCVNKCPKRVIKYTFSRNNKT